MEKPISSIPKLQVKKMDLDKADNNAKFASEQFDRIQRDVKEGGIKVMERIALYAAGIISLTITFLGYLLNQDQEFLSIQYLGIPLHFYLYGGWVLFGLVILFGVTLRKWDSFYTYYFASSYLFQERKNREQKFLELLETDYPVIYREGENKEIIIEKTKKNLGALDKLNKKHKKREQIFWKIKSILDWATLIMFVIGLFLVMLFVVLATNNLISG